MNIKIKGQTVTVPTWWWLLVWGLLLLASNNWFEALANVLILSLPFWQQKRGIKAYSITQMDKQHELWFMSGYFAGKRDGKEEGNA